MMDTLRLKSLYEAAKKHYEESGRDKENEETYLYQITYMTDIKDIENDMLIKYYYINKKGSIIGDELLLFMTASSDDTYKNKKVKLLGSKLSYPEGAYVPLGNGMGKFTLVGREYQRYNLYYTPEGTINGIQQIEKSYTLKEMRMYLRELND